MKQGALRLSAIALGAAAIALLMPVPLASAAVRHHGLAGPAIHRSTMHASYRGAWRGGHHYAYGWRGNYRYGYGHRYAHGWRGYGWRGVAVAGGYGGYYGGGYYRHRHSCWWYSHYDPYDMPSWCGTYSYGYDYGDYGPYVGFAYGYGPGYYGGYGYARRYGFHGGHRFYGGQSGGFAAAHTGAFGGTHFVPRMGGASVSGIGTAHFAGGFHGGAGGAHIGGGGLRIH
jgi:hypothetical protein